MSLTPLNTNRLQTQTVEPCFNTEIIKLFKKTRSGGSFENVKIFDAIKFTSPQYCCECSFHLKSVILKQGN